MKIKNNTVTFERSDNILFDYPYISNGHMLIKLDVIFCFKFKFPEDGLTAAFINKQKFHYEHKRAQIGDDCAWLPDFSQIITGYDHNGVVEAEITPLQWEGSRLILSKLTGKHSWIDESMRELLQGEIRIKDECSPIYNLIGGDIALIVMPLRISRDSDELKMLGNMINCMVTP